MMGEPPAEAQATPAAPIPRLRYTNRSVALAVLVGAGALGAVRAIGASTRVLGWVVVAAILAGLLHPLVARLDRRMPRGLAVAIVALGTLAVVGGMVYSGVDSVTEESRRLRAAAPRAAAELEESERFGELAREFGLREKVQTFVDELPERLRGGDTASALRSAATRGVAYLATSVLTLFLLVHGKRIAQSALAQIRNEERRVRLTWVLVRAYEDAVRYLALTLLRSTAAGLFTWFVCTRAGVPGATLLGLAAGVFSLVPVMGVLMGGLPVILLTAAFEPDRALAVTLAFVTYQVLEVVFVQRRLERASIHVGPVASFVAMIVGLEAYGIGGMIVALVAVVLVGAVVIELAPSEESDLLAAADVVLAGDEPVEP